MPTVQLCWIWPFLVCFKHARLALVCNLNGHLPRKDTVRIQRKILSTESVLRSADERSFLRITYTQSMHPRCNFHTPLCQAAPLLLLLPALPGWQQRACTTSCLAPCLGSTARHCMQGAIPGYPTRFRIFEPAVAALARGCALLDAWGAVQVSAGSTVPAAAA